MNTDEIRYQLISALLQNGNPLTCAELVSQCKASEKEIKPVLRDLVNEKLVIEGDLIPDKPLPQYCWSARWEKEAQIRAVSSKQKLLKAVGSREVLQEQNLDVNSESVRAFYNYIINEYKPPKSKKFLVFLQCSIRRPFSTSPSHAVLKKAISVATGFDPRKDFEICPVHVVVLASRIGPVPYELEDVYPANIRGGGVKHFNHAYYIRIKPILAERMAQYIVVHGHNYEHITTFTESRYGEIMEEAKKIASINFRVLPMKDSIEILNGGTYWGKYWIQLYKEIAGWLEPLEQAKAEARLKEMGLKISDK